RGRVKTPQKAAQQGKGDRRQDAVLRTEAPGEGQEEDGDDLDAADLCKDGLPCDQDGRHDGAGGDLLRGGAPLSARQTVHGSTSAARGPPRPIPAAFYHDISSYTRE